MAIECPRINYLSFDDAYIEKFQEFPVIWPGDGAGRPWGGLSPVLIRRVLCAGSGIGGFADAAAARPYAARAAGGASDWAVRRRSLDCLSADGGLG